MRTSLDYPIRVDWLDLALPGALGLTLAPGTKGQSLRGEPWNRDLEKDLADLASMKPRRVDTLVCLLEELELETYRIEKSLPAYRARVEAHGMAFVSFPIKDLGVPASSTETRRLVEDLLTRLRAGQNVLLHCRGGIGRTGLVAACLLTRLGHTPDHAFALLHAARKERMPETEAQREFVRAFPRPDLVELLLAGRFADARALLPAEQDATADAQVQRAEALVQGPQKALTFDDAGFATLQVGERRYAAGRFSLQTLGELKRACPQGPGRVVVSALSGQDPLTDIGSLQALAAEGTLFQAASQFNCLEAPSEHGPVPVAQYFSDPTQGPRASISAFPGTLVRHYAAPGPGGRFVQTRARQLDLLERALPARLGRVESGYLLSHNLTDPNEAARALEEHFDEVAVGVHEDVQVVFGTRFRGVVQGAPKIAQVFTSTVAAGSYSSLSAETLAALARPLLRAAYLGTLLAAARLGKRRVVLTLIGGGVFGNPLQLIWEAIFWAADEARSRGAQLDVLVNAHRSPPTPDIVERCRKTGGTWIAI